MEAKSRAAKRFSLSNLPEPAKGGLPLVQKKRTGWRNILMIALFLLPFTIFYIVFTIWPVFQGVYVSVYKWGLMGKIRYIGSANYIRLFKDKFFWQALGNTTIFALISVPILVILAFLLAVLANRPAD